MEEFVAYQMAQNEASRIWHEAKVNNDYAAFEPHLAKLIEYQRRFAGYMRPELPAYDALLDQYEKALRWRRSMHILRMCAQSSCR